MPHLGFFFEKKNPKNPKNPDWIGFRLSNIDSKQGCRTAALFLCLAQTAPNNRRQPHVFLPAVYPALAVVPPVVPRTRVRHACCAAETRSSPRRDPEAADL